MTRNHYITLFFGTPLETLNFIDWLVVMETVPLEDNTAPLNHNRG